MAKKSSNNPINPYGAVSEIARVMRISEKKAAEFCESVRRHAKADITTDGQIYHCVRFRKTALTPEAVACYTDSHKERIQKMVGHAGSDAVKKTRKLYPRQYYIYRNSRYQATIHFAACSFCNYGRGSHPETTRGWSGPYESRNSAISAAKKISEKIHLCEHCGATLAIDDFIPEDDN